MSERFELERELGRGGMGVVYLVRDRERGGQRVALKRLSAAADPDALQAEFAAALDLRHPVIVRAYELGRDEHGPFLLMEWVDGDDLTHFAGKVEPARVARWAILIADALEYARRRDLVHGDIKPQNLLVPRDDGGQVKLLDLGLVVRSGERSFGGTIAYVAPELLRGGVSDARSDLFSLGCVLYELLSGSPAFSGVERTVVPALASTVRPDLRELVTRLLSPRPGDRPGRPADLVSLIDAEELRLPLPEGDLVGRQEVFAAVKPGQIVLISASEGMGATRLLGELVVAAELRHDAAVSVFDVDAGAELELLVAEAELGKAVVAVFHPGQLPTIEGATSLELRPLLDDEICELVSSRLPLEATGVVSVGRWVARESGGSPALAVEALECLRDAKILSPGPLGLRCDEERLSTYRPDRLGSDRVARTVARLSAPARAAGARLAVLPGEPAHPELLAARIVEPVAGIGHRFFSESVRRTLEAQLDVDERRELHSLGADRLLGSSNPNPRVLARHLESAGRASEAGPWLWRAGSEARRRGDRAEALRLLAQAVSSLSGAALAGVRLELGDELVLAGRRDEALMHWRSVRTEEPGLAAATWGKEAELHASQRHHSDAMRSVRELQRQARSRGDFAQALALLGRIRAQEGRLGTALRYLDAARACFAGEGDTYGVGKTSLALGNVYFLGRRWDEAIAAYENARAVAESVGARDVRATALQNLGKVYAYYRRIGTRAVEVLYEAVALAESDREPRRLSRSLAALAVIEFDAGRLDSALRNIDRAIGLNSRLEDRTSWATDLLVKAEILSDTGSFDAAEGILALVLRHGEVSGNKLIQISGLEELARVRLERLDHAGARLHLEQALDLIDGVPVSPGVAASLRALLGTALLGLSDIAGAKAVVMPITEAVTDSLDVKVRVCRAKAAVELAEGLMDSGIARLRDVLAELSAAGFSLEGGRVLLDLGMAEARRGNTDEARNLLGQARAIFERQGTRPALARTMLASAKLELATTRQFSWIEERR